MFTVRHVEQPVRQMEAKANLGTHHFAPVACDLYFGQHCAHEYVVVTKLSAFQYLKPLRQCVSFGHRNQHGVFNVARPAAAEIAPSCSPGMSQVSSGGRLAFHLTSKLSLCTTEGVHGSPARQQEHERYGAARRQHSSWA